MGFWNWISNGAKWLGNTIQSGWDKVKSVGKKVWDGIKSIPVVGQIAEGIKNFTPIGRLATSLINGIDAGVGVGSHLVNGDFKGALDSATHLVDAVPGLHKFAPLVRGLGAGVDLARGDIRSALGKAGGAGQILKSGMEMLNRTKTSPGNPTPPEPIRPTANAANQNTVNMRRTQDVPGKNMSNSRMMNASVKPGNITKVM